MVIVPCGLARLHSFLSKLSKITPKKRERDLLGLSYVAKELLSCLCTSDIFSDTDWLINLHLKCITILWKECFSMCQEAGSTCVLNSSLWWHLLDAEHWGNFTCYLHSWLKVEFFSGMIHGQCCSNRTNQSKSAVSQACCLNWYKIFAFQTALKT